MNTVKLRVPASATGLMRATWPANPAALHTTKLARWPMAMPGNLPRRHAGGGFQLGEVRQGKQFAVHRHPPAQG